MSQTGKSATLYLPTELIDRVDAYAEELHARDGVRVPRSQAVVVLLKRALEQEASDEK